MNICVNLFRENSTFAIFNDLDLKKTNINSVDLTNGFIGLGNGNVIAKSTLSILVAEDILINQNVMINMLKKLGYVNVDVAFNGIETLGAFDKKKYDVLLLDMKMPLMDGYQTARELQKRFAKLGLCTCREHDHSSWR